MPFPGHQAPEAARDSEATECESQDDAACAAVRCRQSLGRHSVAGKFGRTTQRGTGRIDILAVVGTSAIPFRRPVAEQRLPEISFSQNVKIKWNSEQGVGFGISPQSVPEGWS